MRILYNFASRSRPQKLIACIENIQAMSVSDNYEIIVTLDVDDVTVANREFNEKLKSYKSVRPIYGFSKNKIDAINKNVWIAHDWRILINMSDDFVFLEKGFDDTIRSDMKKYFPDTDGVLHYPDGSPAKDALCTMSIMGAMYYCRFGYIYHPDYANVYCDDEFTQVAKKINKYKFIDKNLFVHNHPVWNKADWDEQYRKTENKVGYAADYAVFLKRKKEHFGL